MHEHDTVTMRPGGPARVRPYITALDHAATVQRANQRRRIAPYFGILADRRYNTAARDSIGDIRMNQGRGLLVARKSNTRAEIQAWRNLSKTPRFLAQYDAALALIDRENRAALLDDITTDTAQTR